VGGRQGSPLHDPENELQLKSIEERLDTIDKNSFLGLSPLILCFYFGWC
jgi:hypothetical protein